MLVAFLDRDNDVLTPQKKGALFERLARRLAEAAGYRELVLRAKHSSLEYDIEGMSKLHELRLVGEAKAHEANIAGQVVSAFVGKLVPLAAKGSIHGLFISTSPFTAEARDYLEATLPTLPTFGIELRTLVGGDIPQFFVENSGQISDSTLASRVSEVYGLQLLDSWLVCADSADFLVATCGPDSISAATSFAVFKTDGTELTLPDLVLRRLKNQVSGLVSLTHLTTTAELTAESTKVERLPPITAGAGSLDYRFPSPPEHFIGRETPLEELANVVDEVRDRETAVRSVQILSRSGVGKSSLLLKMPSALDVPFVTVDGRNIRSAADARLLVTQAVGRTNVALPEDQAVTEPRSLEEASAALEQVGQALADSRRVLIVQIDQFESTLRLPPVFDAVLNLVETTTSRALPIVWIFARKNDVAVTFDEGAEVALGRLNAISRPIRLDDFNTDESRVMFSQLESVLGESLQPNLANAISTFSAGFPWLHKRLCAHVLTMKRSGVTQRDLVQAGLRAEDLFEEDLAGLTEQDRALLRRVASHLPATAGELATHLEAEITVGRLTDKLNEFLGAKLLRLTGEIYDAYNDVFKTYLVTDQIPFEARYVFRVAPRAATDLLRRIAAMGPHSLADFQQRIGGSPVANLNKLRELRLLGLISSRAGRVELSLEAQEAFENDTLGELLRRRLRGNGLVVRALDLIAANETVTMDALVAELRRELPQVQGVSDTTWTGYAKTLASWLHFASLAQVEADKLTARELPADEALRGRALTRGAFAPETFIPSVRPEKIVQLLGLFDSSEAIPRDEVAQLFGKTRAPGAIQDAHTLSLVEDRDETLVLGYQGRMLLAKGSAITERDVAQLAVAKPNLKALLDATASGAVSEAQQRELMARFGSAKWTDGTWKWRLGILRSWATGLVSSGHAGIRAVDD